MKHLLTFVPDSSREASAEFRISLRSLPWLADHAFQDMIVLPGSVYIEMAVCVYQELTQSTPGVLRNITFRNPVIVSADDTIIKVEARKHGAVSAELIFYQISGENGGSGNSRQELARLEVEGRPSALEDCGQSASVERFQAQAHEVIDGKRFYQELRGNGNQYGPQFRCVSSVWRADDVSLGRLSRQPGQGGVPRPRAALLDSMSQLLAPFMMDRGRPFILRSIDRIQVADLDFPDTLWGRATLQAQSRVESEGAVGGVLVFDDSGKTYLRLSGVSFALLGRAQDSEEQPALRLSVAANFTAEPIEESLKFWAAYFRLHGKVEFAPYDQVFQQLLDEESTLRRNREGVNIILLQLEKWAVAYPDHQGMLDSHVAERYFGKHKRCVLPNGQEIVHLNQYETDYLYKEIFEDNCYLKHGICLRDGATVVDVGANIGLFSLFVLDRCRNAKIYAYEPAPAAYELLRANLGAYSSSALACNFGVSNREGTATFTFYQHSSVFSGFYSDEAEDREAIRAVVRNTLIAEKVADESLDEHVNELTADRLHSSRHECRLKSVSDIMRENHIDKIDLLKIDAEKSELDILAGIADCDWPKIDQIVMEVHDPTRELARKIHELLIGRGYQCALEQQELLEHSGLFTVYAARDAYRTPSHGERVSRAPAADHARRVRSGLQRNVQDLCAALESCQSRTPTPLILCLCPASPAAESNAELKAAIDDAARDLLSRASTLARTSVIGSEFLWQHYPVAEYYDVHGHQLGDVPYTPECYVAIGTALFRAIFNLRRRPFKVIVLDCDNTLWKGVCGEDGPQGIAIGKRYRALQRFMLEQMNAGMLLCLCSKNNEKDVLDVFDQRPDMLLQREHLAAYRINWDSKSENIRSLASELNLALDSFIFIDDNPVDCADVEINCPEVLTLQLPQDEESFAEFFEHLWVFDSLGTTEEDRSRTARYRENTERERFRAQTGSLKDFVAGLLLRIDIAEATDDQLSRVSQLMFRTNQFNFTTIRRTEDEIREFLKGEDTGCLTVRVADRFGDYGLVGVVLYEAKPDRLKLDTFLLSCRVLGRGVEHFILSRVGQQAQATGKKYVQLTCVPTERNLPAIDFVSSLGQQYRVGATGCWLFPAEYLASLRYDPVEKPQSENHQPRPGAERAKLLETLEFGLTAGAESLRRIATELNDVGRISQAIAERRRGPADAPLPEPGGSLETMILNIWKKVLGRPEIGLDGNFFEVGGTSLNAVQVVAMIRKQLKCKLSITSLFECPTVRLLAARVAASAAGPYTGDGKADAVLRGQKRRSMITRRTSQ